MLVEFAMIPLGVGESLAAPLAQVLDIVDKSSLPYKLTPTGTCIEGEEEDHEEEHHEDSIEDGAEDIRFPALVDVPNECDLFFFPFGPAARCPVRDLHGGDAQPIVAGCGRVDGYFQPVAGAIDQRGREDGVAGWLFGCGGEPDERRSDD